ncbi:hypothetical protein WICPIJ_005308 [Wickerhamomyces pijperi]|uniref:Uncharacterized protein n=1 Tax=Wickerhamomyces pijperi TaxID=599730 RepID=A0A9P8TM28_WICPI|nr:hypothetical protein WICPIJ_005308 [Wickerhamomyces pijperi]
MNDSANTMESPSQPTDDREQALQQELRNLKATKQALSLVSQLTSRISNDLKALNTNNTLILQKAQRLKKNVEGL